jgi:hypothetical protein
MAIPILGNAAPEVNRLTTREKFPPAEFSLVPNYTLLPQRHK